LARVAVTATGSGFDPNSSLDLVWQTVSGSWKVDGDKYLGRDYKELSQPLTNVRTDASGSFETKITVPEGFGFYHDVRVLQDKVIRNKAGFYVQMEVKVSPTSGPAGTPCDEAGYRLAAAAGNQDGLRQLLYGHVGGPTNGTAKIDPGGGFA
jgi:hypothetical protein